MLLSLATTKPLHNSDMLFEMVEATSRIPKLVIVPKVRIMVVIYVQVRTYVKHWNMKLCICG